MQAHILDGKAIAAEVRAEWAQHAAEVHKQRGRAPSLAVVLVGDDPASKSYVRGKRKAAAEMGILSRDVDLPADTPEAALRDEVKLKSS